MKTKALIILSLLVVFSCKCKKTNYKMTQNEPVLIAKGNLYGSGSEGIEKQSILITDVKGWNNLKTQMNAVNPVSDSFSETEIDFSNYSIIAVFDEVKGSGGHGIELNITSTSENTLVYIKHTAPEGIATTVMTQPYYIAKILKQDLPVVFKE